MMKTPVAPRNPFVYGRILSVNDAACPRRQYEKAILETARNQGRLALVGDRRLGKSSLVERTLETHKIPVLRWDFQKVLSLEDLIRRAAEDLDRFIGSLSPIARRVTPWLREVGIAIQEIRLSYHGLGATLSTHVPTDHLKRLLSVLLKISSRKSFCLFIDELQDVKDRLPEREGEAVLGILRGDLQHLKAPVFYAGSSRESFRRIFTSDSSPFFESARLLEIEPFPAEDLLKFLITQFARTGVSLAPETALLILSIGGDSPNDIQHLAHEVWNFKTAKSIGTAEIKFAIAKILKDVAPVGETWAANLTRRQMRALLATALYDHLGSGTEEFMRAVGVDKTGAIPGVFKPCVSGPDPIVEKIGSHYRIRSRFLKLWLASQRHLIQEMIPTLREDARYQATLRQVCSGLFTDFKLES
jgi:hypothetical protein